jgi:hypothetical protein
LKTCDTVPQTRADAGRYAFGLSSGIGDPLGARFLSD